MCTSVHNQQIMKVCEKLPILLNTDVTNTLVNNITTVHCGMTTVATVHSGSTTVATVHSGLTTVATVHSGLTTVAPVHSGLTTVATVHSGLTTVATVHSSLTTVSTTTTPVIRTSASPNTTIIAMGGAVGGVILILVTTLLLVVVCCGLLKRRRKAARTGRISMVEDRHTQPYMTPHKQPHLIETTYATTGADNQTTCVGGESGTHMQYDDIPNVKTGTATTGGINTQYDDLLNVKTGIDTATNTQYDDIVNMKSDFNMHTQYDEIPDVKGEADTATTGGVNTQYEDVHAVLLKGHDHTREGSTNTTDGTRAKDYSAHCSEQQQQQQQQKQQQQQDVVIYTEVVKGKKKDKANTKDGPEQPTKGGALYAAVNKPKKGNKDKKKKSQEEGPLTIARQNEGQQGELLYAKVNKPKKKRKKDKKGNLGAKCEEIELIDNEQQQIEATLSPDTPTDTGLTYEPSADTDDTQHQQDGEVNTTQPTPSANVEGLYTEVDKTQKKRKREEE